MQIDLFTLIAQVINFIILLFLLRKFLYLPILKIVEARQKTIADELQAAHTARIDAQKQAAVVAKQTQEIELQKQKILAQAHTEAEEISAALGIKAEDSYRQQQQQWHNRLLSEQNSFDLALQKTAAEYFTQFAQKALQQIADADINQMATLHLLQQIKNLPASKNKEYAAAFKNKKQITVQSAWALNPEVTVRLEDFLRQHWKLPATLKFAYELKPDLICGICIAADEQLIAWNFNDFMQEFRQNMHNTVQQLLTRGEK